MTTDGTATTPTARRCTDPHRNIPAVSIGALGPSGTSSEQAAAYFATNFLPAAISYDVALYDTFDDVLRALLNAEVSLAIVPHAYAGINNYFMHPRLRLFSAFVYDTPDYGLAKKPGATLPQHRCRLSTHPAPFPLLQYSPHPAIGHSTTETSFANSTAAAAHAVAQGDADVAITNERAAAHHKLEMFHRFGPIRMGWSVFQQEGEST